MTVNAGGVLRLLSGASAASSEISHAQLRNIVLNGGSVVLDYAGAGLVYDTASVKLNGPVSAGAGASTIAFGTATAGTGGNSLDGPRTFAVAAGGVLTVSAELQNDGDSAVAGRLVKTGAGALVLTGVNTYTGGAQVDAGTLRVNGSVLGGVTVAGSATLGGSGSIAGAVTVQSGGRLAPGNSPGILTVGGLVGAAGAVFEAELNGPAPGTGYDQLAVNGTVDLGGMTLSPTLGYDPAVGDVLVLIANDETDPVIGTFAGLDEGAAVGLGTHTAVISYLGGTGNDVVLFNFTPIPEPAAAALLLLAAAAAWGLCRRRGVRSGGPDPKTSPAGLRD